MDILFENQYERTEAFHKEVGRYAIYKDTRTWATFVGLGCLFIISTLSVFFPESISLGFSFSRVGNVLFPALTTYAVIRLIRMGKTEYKRDLELNNGKPLMVNMVMNNDEVETFCTDEPEKASQISLKSITGLLITRNYYVLTTKANMLISFKKDGFIKGTPDELISFLKSNDIVEKKVNKKPCVFICLAACILIGLLYWANSSSTISEDLSEPSEEELETIQMILEFEQEKLSEFIELLSPYEGRIYELGVQVGYNLSQGRIINQDGLVVNHDWQRDMWFPLIYISEITLVILKDGNILENRTSSGSEGFFEEEFLLVVSGRNMETILHEDSFEHFDELFSKLLSDVSDFLET